MLRGIYLLFAFVVPEDIENKIGSNFGGKGGKRKTKKQKGGKRSIPRKYVPKRLSKKDKKKILNFSSYYLALNKSNESFGIVLLEAVNNGNLLISSDIDSFKKVMGDSGVYFKNNDIKSLERVIDYCTNNNCST